MLIESGVLYILPFLYRSLQWDGDMYNIPRLVLSLIPYAIVFPSVLLPQYVHNEETEHVWRHSLYAFAFTVSAMTSMRWDVVIQRSNEPWVAPLLTYLGVGTITLWWFVLSHILENTVDKKIRTHQGDVSVLPLTLFAIATFAYNVPDEAFQFL